MEFEDYLKGKKIDPCKFRTSAPEQFAKWKKIFDQVSPNSFTQQKLFLINKIRRINPYTEPIVEKNQLRRGK